MDLEQRTGRKRKRKKQVVGVQSRIEMSRRSNRRMPRCYGITTGQAELFGDVKAPRSFRHRAEPGKEHKAGPEP